MKKLLTTTLLFIGFSLFSQNVMRNDLSSTDKTTLTNYASAVDGQGFIVGGNSNIADSNGYIYFYVASSTATVDGDNVLSATGMGVGRYLKCPTTASASGTAGGDLLGAYPNPTIGAISGKTDGSNASSGKVGEFVETKIATGSAVSLTNGATANVVSISLTAGDWDVQGSIVYNSGTATVTGKTTGITTTSATLPTDGSEVASGLLQTLITGKDGATLPRKRISITSTTTVYLVANCSFSVGTVGAYGVLNARRVR